MQPHCTWANPPRRTITVYPEAHHKARTAARERQPTDAFAEQYARRAGVEGTISQGTRAFGLRQTRYIGLAKTPYGSKINPRKKSALQMRDGATGKTPQV